MFLGVPFFFLFCGVKTTILEGGSETACFDNYRKNAPFFGIFFGVGPKLHVLTILEEEEKYFFFCVSAGQY